MSLDSEPPAESQWAVGGGVDPGRRPTSQSAREPLTLTTATATALHDSAPSQKVIKQSSNDPIKPHFPAGRPIFLF